MPMELDPVGEVGPVRVQLTRKRQSRQGQDYRLPATAALRYVAELERLQAPERGIDQMILSDGQAGNGAGDGWSWETTSFSPVIRQTIAGITSESMRKPILSIFGSVGSDARAPRPRMVGQARRFLQATPAMIRRVRR